MHEVATRPGQDQGQRQNLNTGTGVAQEETANSKTSLGPGQVTPTGSANTINTQAIGPAHLPTRKPAAACSYLTTISQTTR